MKLPEPSYHKNWGWFLALPNNVKGIDRVGVNYDNHRSYIQIEFYFADTKEQADDLYTEENRGLLKRLKKLIKKGWDIETNFHFGVQKSNIHFEQEHWKNQNRYINYFIRNQNIIKGGKKKHVFNIVKMLGRKKIIRYNNKDLLNALPKEKYNSLNPRFNISIRPGFCLRYQYPCEKAVKLDCDSKLGSDINSKSGNIIRIIKKYYRVKELNKKS